MAVEREIINETILDLKENYEMSRKRLWNNFQLVLNKTKDLKTYNTQLIDHFLTNVALAGKDSDLYIRALERFSFSEVIKAYQDENKDELEETEKSKKDVSEKTAEKTKTLYS